MSADAVIGRPLQQALDILRLEGFQPVIVYTRAPAARDTQRRTPRVVAVREDTLVVAFFADGAPKPERE